jgi:hypothetical protein
VALEGDEQCKVNPGLNRCYGTTPEEMHSIMGAGTEITKINAKPWTDALKNPVGGPPLHCYLFFADQSGSATASATQSAAKQQKALGRVSHAA